jgi:hypothetical protein
MDDNTSHPLARAFLDDRDYEHRYADVIPLHTANGVSTRDGRVLNEQPWHRSAAYALLQGKTNKQVAATFDCDPATVSLLRQQSWFRRLIAELAQESLDDGFLGLLQGGANAAIEELTCMLSDTKVPAPTRAAAAGKLLDAFMKAKPPEAPKVPDDPQAELKKLNDEIKRLEQQTGTESSNAGE